MNGIAWIAAGGLVAALMGCGASDVQQQQLQQVQQDVAVQREQLAMLQAQLTTLETVPTLSFALTNYQVQLEELMFQPQVRSAAQLRAEGEGMPSTFYVDMLMRVEVPSEDFVAVNRQVFPVFEGKSQVEMMQPLPVHGLKADKVKVTLRPMNWYGSHRIPEERVAYQQ